jgi:pimeloyl-ACP methyl ester carboxylesterase
MKKGAAPVFMQHGLFSSAETWIVHNTESPAFVIANLGYDVWMGNNRGQRYSRKNKYFDPSKDKPEFFDYSFMELSYDDHAQIDFVRDYLNVDKLAYLAHSQGTS